MCDFAGHLAGQGHAAQPGFRDGLDQFLACGPLQQITAGPRFERVEQMLPIVIDRQHDNRQGGQHRFELAHAVNARHAWQPDVHQDDLGFLPRNLRQGRLAVRDQLGQTSGHPSLILDDGDADGRRGTDGRKAGLGLDASLHTGNFNNAAVRQLIKWAIGASYTGLSGLAIT